MHSIQWKQYDQVFLALFLAIVVFGFFVLASASLGISSDKFGGSYYFLLRQIVYGFLPGIILFFAALHLPYRYLRNFALPALLFSIFLMALVFLPGIGFEHGGASRWINLRFASFQPAEFLKFAYILYLAAWLETRGKELKSLKFGFFPFLIMSAFIASFLVFQPDIGTLGAMMVAVFGLFFFSGAPLKQVAATACIGILIFAALAISAPYRLDRIMTFIDASTDPSGSGYQINQALIAVGSGGLFGKGFGLSRQKFSYLPEPMGDSIYAILSEELGFIGAFSMLMLFLLFFIRGIRITEGAPDAFGRYLGAGLLFLIIFQALINISAIIGIAPLTGIPLPFVSYGGSALAMSFFQVGIILNISKNRF